MHTYSYTFILSTKGPSQLKVKPVRIRPRGNRRDKFKGTAPNQWGFNMRLMQPGLNKFEIKFESDLI